jgi:outer membrane protein assembly factor BamB
MAYTQTPLYVGTNRHVAALDPQTGEELWRTRLPKCSAIGEPVTMVIKDGRLYVGSYGQVWCLDQRDGTLLWRNGLPKLGYHAVLLAMEGAEAGTAQDAAAVVARRRQQQQAAAAGSAGAAGAAG